VPGQAEEKKEGTEPGTAEAKQDEAPPPEAQKAMKGFKIAVENTADQTGQPAGKEGTLGGMGGMFGAMFGGGGGAGAGAPVATGDTSAPPAPTGDTQPPPTADTTTAGGGTTASGIPLDLKLPPPGQAGGDCAAVADRLMGIVIPMIEAQMAEAYKTMTPEQKAAAEQYLKENFKPEEMKAQFVTMCEQQGWSQELKDCVLTAADVPALEKCESLAPKDTTAAAEPPPAETEDYTDDVAAPTATAPEWTGGNSCDDVGTRFMELYMLSMGDTSTWPKETVDEVKKQLEDGMKQFVQSCKDANFSEAVRSCLVKSTSLDATNECWNLMSATP
jgi:hypothetical protein